MTIESFITPVYKVSKDVIKKMRDGGDGHITDSEARFLVDTYYQMQKQRIVQNNQVKGFDRAAQKEGAEPEPHEALSWLLNQSETLEQQVAKLLSVYVETHPMAWFFDATVGVGPIIAAGLLAHIDIRQCPTVGHIYSFAGLNPDAKWEKKTKRPWNAALKVLCWKIGESFVKVKGNERDFYGKLIDKRRMIEWEKNLRGECAAAAEAALGGRRMGDDTDAKAWYSGQCSPTKARAMLNAGKTPTAKDCIGDDGIPMIPPAQVLARAKRYAVKMFLSHLHEEWYRQEVGEPAAPFSIAIQGHAHYIAPPQKASQ